MQYFIQGKNKISLSQNDFIAKGGEAQVFGKGDTVYKIYHDSLKIIPDGKIRELKQLNHPNILIPQDTVLDNSNQRIGLTMKWVKNTMPLCKLFTNDFRNRNGITQNIVIALVEKIKEIIIFIHSQNCLIVDGNEFNYLIEGNNFKEIYFIDTDSYQTPTYPATAIMASVKDYHSKQFTKFTDWFSFAVIACQLFIGIHPYKGNHPRYKRNELEKRMVDNISIFNKDVILPMVVRDFSLIPKNYYQWFIALFEGGERILPPSIAGGLSAIMVQVKTAKIMTNNIEVRLLKDYGEEILYHNICQGIEIIKTSSALYLGLKKYPMDINEEIILTNRKNIPILCDIKNNRLVLRNLSNEQIHCSDILCTDKMIIDNTLYLKNEGNLIEIMFNDMGQKVIATIKNIWNVMPHSSILFSKAIYQSILGKPYLVFPLPKNDGSSQCIYIKVDELDGYKIIDVKYENGVCCLIGFKDNQYDKLILRFNENYSKYDCRIIENVDYLTLNFIVKDNGTVVMINDENNIEIFINQPFNNKINKIDNVTLPLPFKLSKDGNNTLLFKDNKLSIMK